MNDEKPRIETGRPEPVLKVIFACLSVLLVAQILVGTLSLSALTRLVAETTADRVEVTARQAAGAIENGLRLGKPIGQFFGLNDLLPDDAVASGVAVLLPDGHQVTARGETVANASGMARALATRSVPNDAGKPILRASGSVMMTDDAQISVAVPLVGDAGRVVGVLVLAVKKDAAVGGAILMDNVKILVLVTLVAGLGLAVSFKYLLPMSTLSGRGRERFLLPLIALILAQGAYASYTINTFRHVSLQVTRDNVELLATGLKDDLNRVLAYGIGISDLSGAEKPLGRLVATLPTIRSAELRDATGTIIAQTVSPVDGNTEPAGQNDLTLTLPLGAETAAIDAQGALVMRLDGDIIAAGVRGRVIDAFTVVGVATVSAIELLLLLSLMISRTPASSTASDGSDAVTLDVRTDVGRMTRPVMFGFLFAWALPLGFLPLYARSLPADGIALSPDLMMALPISVEMGCGLLATLLAGRLTDRYGWQVPALAGLALASLGMLLCALATTLPWFTAARGAVGLGYGLTWMGLQGLVVTRSQAKFRGRNMTIVVAGLFAGHLSGASVGAMLMEQLGFRSVFAVGAIMMALPAIGVLVLMRPYMNVPPAIIASTTSENPLKKTVKLLSSRGFGMLLLGSIIPFSVAQVGLISFALPLYLEAEGVAASNIGRVLMVYGLCVIYIGPLMGRLVDRSSNKKSWIAFGGVIGSVGLFALCVGGGIAAATAAVLMLALASCFAGASQSPYMLSLPAVQQYGAAGATSVMRAADKLGQMAGPLVVGSMFGAMGMATGLAVTGTIYLAATLLFLLFAPSRSPEAEQALSA